MDIIYKLPIFLILAFIVFSLAEGMYFLAKDDGSADKTRLVKALTIRIVLSIVLFGFLIIGYLFGLLQPHGL
jgi:heme/copper-type cytochrome/quinol oxidase subunit 4